MSQVAGRNNHRGFADSVARSGYTTQPTCVGGGQFTNLNRLTMKRRAGLDSEKRWYGISQPMADLCNICSVLIQFFRDHSLANKIDLESKGFIGHLPSLAPYIGPPADPLPGETVRTAPTTPHFTHLISRQREELDQRRTSTRRPT